jgi:hypothetical protein
MKNKTLNVVNGTIFICDMKLKKIYGDVQLASLHNYCR